MTGHPSNSSEVLSLTMLNSAAPDEFLPMMLPECISWARIGYTYERSVISYGGEKGGGGTSSFERHAYHTVIESIGVVSPHFFWVGAGCSAVMSRFVAVNLATFFVQDRATVHHLHVENDTVPVVPSRPMPELSCSYIVETRRFGSHLDIATDGPKGSVRLVPETAREILIASQLRTYIQPLAVVDKDRPHAE